MADVTIFSRRNARLLIISTEILRRRVFLLLRSPSITSSTYDTRYEYELTSRFLLQRLNILGTKNWTLSWQNLNWNHSFWVSSSSKKKKKKRTWNLLLFRQVRLQTMKQHQRRKQKCHQVVSRVSRHYKKLYLVFIITGMEILHHRRKIIIKVTMNRLH